jgi:hypothetical protein
VRPYLAFYTQAPMLTINKSAFKMGLNALFFNTTTAGVPGLLNCEQFIAGALQRRLQLHLRGRHATVANFRAEEIAHARWQIAYLNAHFLPQERAAYIAALTIYIKLVKALKQPLKAKGNAPLWRAQLPAPAGQLTKK